MYFQIVHLSQTTGLRAFSFYQESKLAAYVYTQEKSLEVTVEGMKSKIDGCKHAKPWPDTCTFSQLTCFVT